MFTFLGIANLTEQLFYTIKRIHSTNFSRVNNTLSGYDLTYENEATSLIYFC